VVKFKFLIIFALLSYSTSEAQAAESPCRQYLSSLFEKTRAPWYQDKKYVIETPGYLIPDAIVLDGVADLKSSAVLTEQYFVQFQKPIPSGAKPISLKTYGYYDQSKAGPRGINPLKAFRGAGRDHLIRDGVGVKGSGVNPEFSTSNGDFKPLDWRTNGMLMLGGKTGGSGLVEYITAKNLEKMGIPVVEHKGLLLLPEEIGPHLGIAEKLAANSKSKDFNNLSIQIVRDLDAPRESMLQSKSWVGVIPEENRMELAGSLYFWDVTHGALNPENLSATGKVIDMGHVGPGYPLTTMGVRRCTVCNGRDGGTLDQTFVGPLEYLFPKPGKKPLLPTFVFKLSHSQHEQLLFSMQKKLGPKTKKIELTVTETKALEKLYQEQFKRMYIANTDTAKMKTRGVLGNTALQETEMLKGQLKTTKTERYGSGFIAFENESLIEGNHAFSTKFALSPRFLMQIEALGIILGPKVKAQAIQRVFKMVAPGLKNDLKNCFGVFERSFKEAGFSAEDLKPLFEQYHASFEVTEDVTRTLLDLGKTGSYSDVPQTVRRLIDRYTEPMQIHPQNFFEVIMNL
jgi:hypothetical protein